MARIVKAQMSSINWSWRFSRCICKILHHVACTHQKPICAYKDCNCVIYAHASFVCVGEQDFLQVDTEQTAVGFKTKTTVRHTHTSGILRNDLNPQKNPCPWSLNPQKCVCPWRLRFKDIPETWAKRRRHEKSFSTLVFFTLQRHTCIH